MEITEQRIHLLAKVTTEVQARFTDFSDLAHGIEHVHRVYHLALYLAEPATLEARVLYDADRLDSLGASGVMRWAMTAKHGRWPEMRTYHPDDPFALWRDPDGQRYLLDRFFTQLLQLNEAMTTATGRAMAERRVDFLRRYLQELQQELAEGGYGYDMPEEVTYRLLWDEKRAEEQKQEQPAEDLQRGGVVAIHRIYDEQHSA